MQRPLTETDWLQYEIAEKLTIVESDPEDRPFQSKYESRTILSRLRTKLLEYLERIERTETDERMIIESALATFSYEMAQNCYSTEERPAAETWAKEALQRINQVKNGDVGNVGDMEKASQRINQVKDGDVGNVGDMEKAFLSAEIALRNTLGCIYCERSDSEAAIACLREAEQLYEDWAKSKLAPGDSSSPPWEMKRPIHWACGVLENITDRFSMSDDAMKAFEQLHTYSLYYLAQAYKLKGDTILSAKYCEITLARQLETGTYDPVEWSVNAATLSVYYVGKSTQKAFYRARHCLAAADAVLDLSMSGETSEKHSRARADVRRCWAKYGLALLEESRQRHPCENGGSVSDNGDKKESDSVIDDLSAADDFASRLPNFSSYEEGMTCDFATTFAEARDVFLKIQRHLTAAQSSFYTLSDHATDYTELAQDSSRAYKALIFFESDIDRKCKMHKRRIDLLVDVYKELNPSYYLAIRRQIAFELGEIYNDMLDLKVEIADERTKGLPNTHQIAKINVLARSGIKYFQEFLQSFDKQKHHQDSGDKQQVRDTAISKYDPADVRPVVLAHFYCARLYSKLLTGDMKEKIVYCQASLSEYRWVVDYIDRVDPDSLDTVKSEYDVCKDMVSLLPMKMDRMRDAMT